MATAPFEQAMVVFGAETFRGDAAEEVGADEDGIVGRSGRCRVRQGNHIGGRLRPRRNGRAGVLLKWDAKTRCENHPRETAVLVKRVKEQLEERSRWCLGRVGGSCVRRLRRVSNDGGDVGRDLTDVNTMAWRFLYILFVTRRTKAESYVRSWRLQSKEVHCGAEGERDRERVRGAGQGKRCYHKGFDDEKRNLCRRRNFCSMATEAKE